MSENHTLDSFFGEVFAAVAGPVARPRHGAWPWLGRGLAMAGPSLGCSFSMAMSLFPLLASLNYIKRSVLGELSPISFAELLDEFVVLELFPLSFRLTPRLTN